MALLVCKEVMRCDYGQRFALSEYFLVFLLKSLPDRTTVHTLQRITTYRQR